jgi:hypothetical protein
MIEEAPGWNKELIELASFQACDNAGPTIIGCAIIRSKPTCVSLVHYSSVDGCRYFGWDSP